MFVRVQGFLNASTVTSPDFRFPLKDCWALRRGRVNKMVATASPLYCVHIGSDPPDYAMCVPLAAQGETLGILYFDSGKVKLSGHRYILSNSPNPKNEL
jgi:hypothetical protein